eukprot:GHVO01052039.1.p1 GENE.GHVO01052039.1~~GHVO01052039.1.p1  ORF type:complete len:338 (-),score=36.74 GHVO01052039.1:475-1488(-)
MSEFESEYELLKSKYLSHVPRKQASAVLSEKARPITPFTARLCADGYQLSLGETGRNDLKSSLSSKLAQNADHQETFAMVCERPLKFAKVVELFQCAEICGYLEKALEICRKHADGFSISRHISAPRPPKVPASVNSFKRPARRTSMTKGVRTSFSSSSLSPQPPIRRSPMIRKSKGNRKDHIRVKGTSSREGSSDGTEQGENKYPPDVTGMWKYEMLIDQAATEAVSVAENALVELQRFFKSEVIPAQTVLANKLQERAIDYGRFQDFIPMMNPVERYAYKPKEVVLNELKRDLSRYQVLIDEAIQRVGAWEKNIKGTAHGTSTIDHHILHQVQVI